MDFENLYFNLVCTIVKVGNPFVVGDILLKLWNLEVELFRSGLSNLVTVLIIGVKMENELLASGDFVLKLVGDRVGIWQV
jgi:hypothetical protein